MSYTALNLVGQPQPEPEEETVVAMTIGEQLREIIAQQREELVIKVTEWLIYSVKQGIRQMFLDECPGITEMDKAFVVAWLREQGMTIIEPKWNFFGSAGRVTISIS